MRTDQTPAVVKRIVNDIDDIVKNVRYDGWQNTITGERLVQKSLRKTLLRYKLHKEEDLFDRAYEYIKEYYYQLIKYKLSKSTFIRGLQCEKSLYLYKHHYKLIDPTPSFLQAVFDQGTNIGLLAHELFPYGVDASPENHFKWSFFQNKLQTSPKQLPPKTTTQEYKG